MPTDQVLIPAPVLDSRSERERIRDRLDRTIGNYTRADAVLMRDTADDLIALIDAGETTAVPDRLAPELVSVRGPEAHTTLLTEMERSVIEMQYAINLLPEQNRIALYRILGVTLQSTVAASCTLRFTKTDGFLSQSVLVPAGTEVSTLDRTIRVATLEDLTIAANVTAGTVLAESVTTGDIGRVPSGLVALLLTSIAGIGTVTNTTDLAGGRNEEPTVQAEIRAREEMRAGNHLTTAQDWVDFLYFETLRRRGRVTPFEHTLYDFTFGGLGYLLLVVQDERGLAPSESLLQSVSQIIAERHVAGVQVTARAANYQQFDIHARVHVRTGASAPVLLAQAEANLRAFFNPLNFRYGPTETERFISLSDITGQIEAAGPDRISVDTTGNQFAVYIVVGGDALLAADLPLLTGELPSLQQVVLTSV